MKKTNTPPTTAAEFLAGGQCILDQRGKDYDTPGGERSMLKTVEAFNTITGHNITEADGWQFMSILKKVRQYQTPKFHRDSAEDDINYSALAAEAMAGNNYE